MEGMLGFEPNAPGNSFLTVSRLPGTIAAVEVSNIPLGGHRVNVAHEGVTKSTVTHVSGDMPLKWEACFYGNHSTIAVDGKEMHGEEKQIHGVKACFVSIDLPSGQSATAEVVQQR